MIGLRINMVSFVCCVTGRLVSGHGEYRECPYVNMTTGAGYIHWYGLKVFFNKVFEIESLLSADRVEVISLAKWLRWEVRGI